MGKSAGRAQVRAGGDPGSAAIRGQAEHPGARRCRNGRQDVGRVGGRKARCDVPDPGCPHGNGDRTLDAKFMAERVVVRDGTNTTEFTYSDYRDWNNPLHPAEAFVAGRMTERRNGTVVRDITTTLTETGQMYVVMPVPASVKAAIKPTLQPPNWVSAFPTVPWRPPAPRKRRGSGRNAEAGQREARHDG